MTTSSVARFELYGKNAATECLESSDGRLGPNFRAGLIFGRESGLLIVILMGMLEHFVSFLGAQNPELRPPIFPRTYT